MFGKRAQSAIHRLLCCLLAALLTVALTVFMMFAAAPISTAHNAFEESNNLRDFLSLPNSSLNIEGLTTVEGKTGEYQYSPGQEATLNLVFSEDPNGLQFGSSQALTYELPAGFTPITPAVGEAQTFPVMIHHDNTDLTIEGNTWTFDPIENSDARYQLVVQLNSKDPNFTQLESTHNIALNFTAHIAVNNPARETTFAPHLTRQFVPEHINTNEPSTENQSHDDASHINEAPHEESNDQPTPQWDNGKWNDYTQLNLWMKADQIYEAPNKEGRYVYWAIDVNSKFERNYSGQWIALEMDDWGNSHQNNDNLRQNMQFAGEGITFQTETQEGMIDTTVIPWSQIKENDHKWSYTFPQTSENLRYRITYKTLVKSGIADSGRVSSTVFTQDYYWTASSNKGNGGDNPWVNWDDGPEPENPNTDALKYESTWTQTKKTGLHTQSKYISEEQTQWNDLLALPNWDKAHTVTFTDELPYTTINGKQYTDLLDGMQLNNSSQPAVQGNIGNEAGAAQKMNVVYYDSNGNPTPLQLYNDYDVSFHYIGDTQSGNDQRIQFTVTLKSNILNGNKLKGKGELHCTFITRNSASWMMAAVTAGENKEQNYREHFKHTNRVSGFVNNTVVVPNSSDIDIWHAAGLVNQLSTNNAHASEDTYPAFVRSAPNANTLVPVWFFRVMLDKTSLVGSSQHAVQLNYDKSKFQLVTPTMFGGIEHNAVFSRLMYTNTFVKNNDGSIIPQSQKPMDSNNFSRYFTNVDNPDDPTSVVFPNYNDDSAWIQYDGNATHLGFVYALTPTQTYLDQINKDAQASSNKTLTFENAAHYTNVNGAPDHTNVVSSATFNYSLTDVHKYVVQEDQGKNTITFGIDVNPTARNINSGDAIDVYDDMSDGLRWDSTNTDSITITNTLTGENITRSIPIEKVNKRFKFTLPDATSIHIAMKTRVFGSGEVKYTNTATLNAGNEEIAKSQVTGDFHVSSNAFGEGENRSIYIYKYAQDNMNDALSGAVFKLLVPVGDTYQESTSTYVTNSDGIAHVDTYTLPGKQGAQSLDIGKKYGIKEIKAPEGFKPTTETTYFTLVNSSINVHEVENPIPISGTVLSPAQGWEAGSLHVQVNTPHDMVDLSGAQFCIEHTAQCVTTDTKGYAAFGSIDTDDFTVVQKKAPHGYTLPQQNQWNIRKTNDGRMEIVEDHHQKSATMQTFDNQNVLRVTNDAQIPVVLPSTGGVGRMNLFGFGAACVMAAFVLAAVNSSRKHSVSN